MSRENVQDLWVCLSNKWTARINYEGYNMLMKTISSFNESDVLDKVDIGTWSTYQSFSDKEQISIQRENFTITSLNNGYSDIKCL